MIYFREVQKPDHPQREFATPPRCLLLPRLKLAIALVFSPFSGWLGSSDYCYKQPDELGRGLRLCGRPVTMRKKGNIRR